MSEHGVSNFAGKSDIRRQTVRRQTSPPVLTPALAHRRRPEGFRSLPSAVRRLPLYCTFVPMLVSVALPLPLFRTFTYEVDDGQAGRARVGMRAVVPFHGRRDVGVIVGA